MNNIQKAFNWLVGAIIVMFVTIACIGAFAVVQAQANREVMCSFRDNLQKQVDDQRKYLVKVEAGERRLPDGIERADITNAIRRQQATLDSIRDLDCKGLF